MLRSAGRPLLARLSDFALAVCAVGALGACTEKTESNVACSTLCPEETLAVKDTTLDIISIETVNGRVDTTFVVSLDSTLAPFPARGATTHLLVASRGSQLDARGVVRFDALATTFNRSTTETNVPVTAVTKSWLRFYVDTAGSKVGGPFTVNVYDVDTSAPDNDEAAVLALFTGGRLLGSRTFGSKDEIRDSLVVPLDTAKVRAKVVAGARLRVGVQVSGSAETTLRLNATVGGSSTYPTLNYDPTDTTDAIRALTVAPSSASPASVPSVAFALNDYTIVATPMTPLERDALGVGGLPARRTFLRFAIPATLLDSTTIVRATLLLRQRPSPGLDPTLTDSLATDVVQASGDVTDISRLTTLAGETFPVGGSSSSKMPTLALKPGEAGEVAIQIPALLRFYWRNVMPRGAPRAIVLRAAREGSTAAEFRFYSNEVANPALRPRLRLTYIPRAEFGVP